MYLVYIRPRFEYACEVWDNCGVLWIVGGTRWRKYSGAIPHFILKNNWSFLRYLRDNCGIGYSDKLEKLKLDAARIVTGLTIFIKSEY
jgi:hypothetical protein